MTFVERPAGMLIDGLVYGGDYNPEQWDESVLLDDIALMKEAGVNVVTVGVFSWALLEPAPGDFRLDWMTRVLDELHAAGIGVDLATSTASPPPWLGELYPATLPTTRDGNVLVWGSRQQYNPSSEELRRRIRTLVTRLAKEFAHHPALVAWHVNNEYGCHVMESFDDESAARFRSWLHRRYGSIDELNRAWGTAFWSQRLRDWNEVIPPLEVPALHNPHQLDDWRAFCSDTLLDLYLLERDILRAANPAVPITTNFMGLFPGLDYWEWAKHVDFVSNDSYPDPANPRAAREFALECDLMRSLGGGRPFVQMEQATSAVQWRARNASKRPGQYALWSLIAVARGADGILNFQWRQSIAGSETFHGAMMPHAGRDSRTWNEVVELGDRLAALSVVRGAAQRAHVAIVWDWKNLWAYQDAIGPTSGDAPEDAARAWHASLYELGLLVDFIHPDDGMTAYDVVIVPALFRLTTTHAQALRNAAHAGVHLLVTCLSGYVDAQGHAVKGGYLAAISDLLGVRVVDLSPRGVTPDVRGIAERIEAGTDRLTTAVATPAADPRVVIRGAQGDEWPGHGLGWAERVVVDDPGVEIVAIFDDGDVDWGPAVTALPANGGGTAWYVATSLDARARLHLLRQVLPGEVWARTSTDLPDGVDKAERGGVTFYFNHGEQPVMLTDPSGVDLEAGQSHDGALRIPPRGAALIRALHPPDLIGHVPTPDRTPPQEGTST